MVTNFKYRMKVFILMYKSEGTLTYILFSPPRTLFLSFPFWVLLLIHVQPALKHLKYLNHKQTSITGKLQIGSNKQVLKHRKLLIISEQKTPLAVKSWPKGTVGSEKLKDKPNCSPNAQVVLFWRILRLPSFTHTQSWTSTYPVQQTHCQLPSQRGPRPFVACPD